MRTRSLKQLSTVKNMKTTINSLETLETHFDKALLLFLLPATHEICDECPERSQRRNDPGRYPDFPGHIPVPNLDTVLH